MVCEHPRQYSQSWTRILYEADLCLRTVEEAYEEHVLSIKKVEGMGFLGDAKKHVLIETVNIHVPSNMETYAARNDMEN